MVNLAITQRFPPRMLRISEPGLTFIKRWERLMTKAYLGEEGEWTIGFGHKLTAKEGMIITEMEAINLLRMDVRSHESILRLLRNVTLLQREYDALTSLIFNIGIGAFAKSTLRRKLEQGDFQAAADEFPKWKKVKGKVSNGLVRRRDAERNMFLTGEYLRN